MQLRGRYPALSDFDAVAAKKTAILENGETIQYDICAESKDEYPLLRSKVYLGQGMVAGRMRHLWNYGTKETV